MPRLLDPGLWNSNTDLLFPGYVIWLKSNPKYSCFQYTLELLKCHVNFEGQTWVQNINRTLLEGHLQRTHSLKIHLCLLIGCSFTSAYPNQIPVQIHVQLNVQIHVQFHVQIHIRIHVQIRNQVHNLDYEHLQIVSKMD